MVRLNARRKKDCRGLTLIELVLVLSILAAVAGLVIPQVANLGRTTDMAASAKTQADLASNLQLHFVQLKRMPQGMDSLLLSDGTTPTGVFLPQDLDGDGAQDTGLPDSGPHLDEQLAMVDLADIDGTNGTQFRRSLSRTGFDWVYDHDENVLNANDSAIYQRDISSSSGDPYLVAEIVPETAIANAIFPEDLDSNGTGGDIPSNIRLVAVGVGPRCSLQGKTSLNAPIYPGNDSTYYGRYVAIFKVYSDGRRSQLAMTTDAYGRFPDYTIKQYNETLPEGGRRG